MTCQDKLKSDVETARWGWVARRRARRNWCDKAEEKYGASYANWSNSTEREYSTWGPRRQAKATASARPCN